MTWAGLAIALHLLGVMWWLGGLAFVTLVFLPALRSDFSDNPHVLLEAIERRFAPQARIAVILVGLSGGYLLWALGAWQRLALVHFWWLDAMIGYWLVFVIILFIIEPMGLLEQIVFTRWEPTRAWRRFHALHAVLLAIGVVIIAAAAAGHYG